MSTGSSNRVVVAMSGGVDSSVAALLLVQQGLDVHGLFMSNWEEDEEGYCTAAQDFQDANRVCRELGIPLHRVDFAPEYRERVFRYFLEESAAGRTPNPDVLCNREIKFGTCLEYARRLGADRFATGHYARTTTDGSRTLLCRSRDRAKDQTYFLHAVPGEALRDAVFPVGELEKSEVRTLAKEHGLNNHAKRDSTGICFIGERHFREFLSRYLPAQPGDIRSPSGTLLGSHQGLMFYTLGQRRGLGIGGQAGYDDGAWFVARKDLNSNTLIVVQGHDDPILYDDVLLAGGLHWIDEPPAPWDFRCTAKSRYRQTDRSCVVDLLDPDRGLVRFDQPQRALTPGQYVVFYQGQLCLGGGVIEAVGNDARAAASGLRRAS